MPALTPTEHQRVLRETKDERNARAWVRRRGGTVDATPYSGALHYRVKIPGFHPKYGTNLALVVAALRFAVDSWAGEKGPTGARLRSADGDS